MRWRVWSLALGRPGCRAAAQAGCGAASAGGTGHRRYYRMPSQGDDLRATYAQAANPGLDARGGHMGGVASIVAHCDAPSATN